MKYSWVLYVIYTIYIYIYLIRYNERPVRNKVNII